MNLAGCSFTFTPRETQPRGVHHQTADGCLRAVEHLRLVFAELHAVTIRETVSFHSAHGSFDADSKPLDKRGSQEAAAKMLHQLPGGRGPLLLARTSEPYPA